MMNRKIRLPALLLSAILTTAMFAACGQGTTTKITQPATSAAVKTAEPTPTATPTAAPTPTPTPRPIATIYGILPGTKPDGMNDVLLQLNDKLSGELSIQLELVWSPADQYDKNAEAAAASGDKADFIWCSSSKLAAYAAKGLIAPVDGLMAEYGKDLQANIGAALFDTMKIGGKLMGVPSAGNTPLSGAGLAFIYREDLLQKYGLPKPDSIANMEAYFKAIAANEPELTPFSAGDAADIIVRASGLPGSLAGSNGSVAVSFNADGAAMCVAVQQSEAFKQAVLKAREWYKAGWLPKDNLSIKDPSAAVSDGTAASTVGAVNAVISMQAALSANIEDAKLSALPLSSSGFLEGNGDSALCLTSASKAPDRVVQFWNWVYANQDNYDLLCYGVKGQNYTVTGDRIAYLNDNYSGFPSWIFGNVNLMLFPQGVPDDYIDTLKHWNDGAAVSPLVGFAFDPAPVKNELAKVKTIYLNYYPQLNSGSGDAESLLMEFDAKMAAAGQDKIVAEAQRQVDAFLAAKQ